MPGPRPTELRRNRFAGVAQFVAGAFSLLATMLENLTPERASTMACPERLRLQQLLEVSVRRWAQVAASSQLFGQTTFDADDVRLRVLAERNAANNRLLMHQQECNRCLRN
jgi:hypothetical protein